MLWSSGYARPVHRRTSWSLRLALAVIVGLSLATALSISGSRAARADVVTNSGNNQRTGWYSNQAGLSPSAVGAGNFGQLASLPVTGQVYAQPVIGNNTMVVATEHNMIYGYNVSATNPTPLWSRSLGDPTANPKGCVDINPEIGVTSTPVVDSTTGTAYIMSNAYTDASHTTQSFYLHAVDLASGAERAGFPVEIKGSAANDPSITFGAAKELQRPGLLLMNGVVYAGFSGHCDAKPFQGWIAGVSTTSATLTTLWSDETSAGVASDGPGGGIWMSGSGLMSDQSGDIVFTTGNGTPPPTGPADPSIGTLGQSLVRLRVQGDGSLRTVDYFAPYDASVLNESDSDVGSGGVVALPSSFGTAAHPRVLINVGKQGEVWLTDANNLGGVGQGALGGDAVLSRTDIQGGVRGKPAVWGGDGGYIYIATSQSGAGNGQLEAFKYGLNPQSGNPQLSLVGQSKTSSDPNSLFGFGSGSPVVTSDGTTSGSALVWTVWFPPSPPAGQTGVGAQLRAYDPIPVNGQLQLRKSLPVAAGTKFAVPAVNNGRLYLGTNSGQVLVFGAPVAAPFSGPDVTFPPTTVGTTSTATATLTATTSLTLTGAPATNNAAFSVLSVNPPIGTVIPAGGTLSVALKFAPTAAGGGGAALSIPTSAGAFALSLSGTGRDTQATLQQNACCATFGGVATGDSSSIQVLFSNAGAGDLQISGYTLPASGSPFSVAGLPPASAAAPAVLHSGQSFTATFTFAPKTVGLFTDTFRLTTNDPTATGDDGAAGSVSLAGSGGTPALITATPSTVAYGGVTVGTTVVKKFTISNSGGTDLSLTVSKPPGGYGFTPLTSVPEGTVIPAGGSLNVNVAFTPTMVGAASDTWQIGGTAQGRQTVTFTGTGTAVGASGPTPVTPSPNPPSPNPPSTTPPSTIPPVFTAASPPSAVVVGAPYSYQFGAGGVPAPTYSVVAGAPPSGLSLTASGLLTGVPTAAGTFTFTVRAHNSAGDAFAAGLTVTVFSVSTAVPSAVRGPVPASGVVRLHVSGVANATVFGNLTVVSPQSTGYAVAYPCAQPRPVASNVNFTAHHTTANFVTVASDNAGDICIFTLAKANLIWDQVAQTSAVPAHSAQRVLDTRAPGRTVAPNAVVRVHVSSAPFATVFGNLTVVSPQSTGYVSAYPCASGRPNASNVNFAATQTTSDFAAVAADGAGNICIYTTSRSNLIWDQVAQSSAVAAHAAQRLLDTRAPGRNVPAGHVTAVHVSAVPGATVLANLTVIQPRSSGYAVAYPCASSRPVASNVNFAAGQTRSNFVVVASDPAGNVCLYSTSAANLVFDQVAQSTAITATNAVRLLDTR